MNVSNRTPAIAEDTVYYALYLPMDMREKPSATSLVACIESFVESSLPGFIWHRDSFSLKVVADPDADGNEWMLQGLMRVGDCVDDECVYDSDGDFLLIEAADFLPSWAKPSNTENRVWIYRSHLHLIPLQHVTSPSTTNKKRTGRSRATRISNKDSDIEGNEELISVKDALCLVRDEDMQTRAPEAVEQTVWERISSYPSKAKLHVHRTKAFLPVDIALALSANPSCIQKAVEVFYTRDAVQLRSAHRMSRFPPEPSVLTTVKMTRTAYAQLVGQKFYPPRVFGRCNVTEGSKEWKWRDIGMKIACGFEMLYQESKGRSNASSHSIEAARSSSSARKDALRRDPNYQKYIQNLISAGYFKGEREGSQLWSTLEDKAAAAYIEANRDDDANRTSFAAQVAAAIAQAKETPFTSQEDEDSDEWLNVDAHDLDRMFQRSAGDQNKPNDNSMDVDEVEGDNVPSEDKTAREQAKKLSELAKKVEAFVEGEGRLESARFEDEKFSDEEFGDESMSDSDDEDGSDGQYGVDEATDRAARQAAMDKLIPGLAPSEYGQMPPLFYINSQKVTKETAQGGESTKKTAEQKSSTAPSTKPIRPPIIMRDRYDGVDSDDETDSEDEGDDNEAEDQPQVVGEVEIDMADEEEEFLEFSRRALGITDAQWGEIISERKGRGAFVPAGIPIISSPSTKKGPVTEPPPSQMPVSPTHPGANPNLNSFEAVMQAMDVELAHARSAKKKGKGKEKAEVSPPSNEKDIEAMMDAELKSVLEQEAEDEDEDGENAMDYGLIKNFLESFKSQGGLSGPVSNLVGKLQPGWNIPRDES